MKFLNFEKTIRNEDAATELSYKLPNVKDKILNTLQLIKIAEYNMLAKESVNQRLSGLNTINFSSVVDYSILKKTYLYFFSFISFVVLIALFFPTIFTDGTIRYVNFTKNYEKPAPFQFIVQNENLTFLKNQDATITVKIDGEYIPKDAFLIENNFKHKLIQIDQSTFMYEFKNIQNSFEFYLSSSGYNSKNYQLNVFPKPIIKNISCEITYPNYLNRKNEVLKNANNFIVPEGTNIKWNAEIFESNKSIIYFSDSTFIDIKNDNKHKIAKNSFQYQFKIENDYSKQQSAFYHVDIIKDLYPSINVNTIIDSVMYKNVFFNGFISDDYGLKKLKIFYKKNKLAYKSKDISINQQSIQQNFYYDFNIDTILQNEEDVLSYYFEIFDNDGVNGSKSTRTSIFNLKLPDSKKIKEEIKQENKKIENSIKESIEELNKLEKEISKIDQNIKSKKSFNWNDKEKIKELLQNQKQLTNEIDKISEELKKITEKQDKFENQPEKLVEKAEKLQELMEELLDEETKKLLEELEKLLNENNEKNEQEIKDKIEELSKEDVNLEKELDRMLDLFKKLQMEQKMEQIGQELDKLSEKQEKLTEEENKNVLEEQNKLNEKFEEIKKELNEVEKLNEELNQQSKEEQNEINNMKESISNEMNDASKNLMNQKSKNAKKNQQKASKDMKAMSKMLKDQMSGMESEQQMEDLNALRQILDNLISLSFDQEFVLDEFKKIRKVNPKFVELSEKQLKIKENSKIIEDSLLSLASRVFQIESFVTKELFEMNEKIDESLKAIKKRDIRNISVNQQLAMTSINNLALMLSDMMDQMQKSMANQTPGDKMCNQPNGKGKKPGQSDKLSDMQKQLNSDINSLKKSGKTGKELSKELSKLAAQQEAIRDAYKQMEKQGGVDKSNKGNGSKNNLDKLMEETERELVNKKLVQKTLLRQEEILTRLLEAEDAMRTQKQDNQRESETSKEKNRINPPELEKYIKEKEKELEQLRTINPNYSNYYKKEVYKYFNNNDKR